jgi:hypothetical protein
MLLRYLQIELTLTSWWCSLGLRHHVDWLAEASFSKKHVVSISEAEVHTATEPKKHYQNRHLGENNKSVDIFLNVTMNYCRSS